MGTLTRSLYVLAGVALIVGTLPTPGTALDGCCQTTASTCLGVFGVPQGFCALIYAMTKTSFSTRTPGLIHHG